MSRRGEHFALAAILGLAALVRFVGLDSVPPGLLLDEAGNALLAQAVLRGEDPRPWLHALETPTWTTAAVLFSVLPDSVAVLRWVPAFWGTVTVLALWWTVRQVSGSTVALAAAFALSVLRWHVALSRIAIAGYLTPLAAVVAVGSLFRAIRLGSRGWAAVSGLVAGAGMHWYAGARILPLVVGAGVAGCWRDEHPLRRRVTGGWLTGFIAGFATGGWYLIWAPGHFLDRIIQVAGEAGSLRSWFSLTLQGLGALNINGGGMIATYPAPEGSPLLGWVASLSWIPGIIIALRGTGTPARWVLVSGLASGVLAAAFGGPHGIRQAILAPVAATGGAVLATALARRLPSRWSAATLAAFAVAHAGCELWWYGPGGHGRRDQSVVERTYCAGDVALAKRLRDECGRRPVFWSPDVRNPAGTPLEWYAGPVIFLATPPVRREAPASVEALEASGGVVAFPATSDFHLGFLREIYPGGEAWSAIPSPAQRIDTYLVDSKALRRGKVDLKSIPALFRSMWEAEDALAMKKPGVSARLCATMETAWPRLGGVSTMLAGALLGEGDLSGCERASRRAISRGAAGGLSYMFLGSALLGQDRFRAAAGAFSSSIEREAHREEAWLGLAVALINDGRRDRAGEVLRDAASRFPESGGIAQLLAGVR